MACRGKCEANQTISRQIIQDGFAIRTQGCGYVCTYAVDVDGLSSHLGDVERSNVSYGNWMGREEGRGLGGSGVIQWGGEGSGENVGKGARIHGAL